MGQDIVNNDLHVNGTLSSKLFHAPSGSIDDTAIQGAAKILSTKLGHRRNLSLELFEASTAIAALTKWLVGIHGAAGTIVAIKAAIAVQATDVSRTVTVDLQKSTGGGAFATVLSATIGFTNASVVRTFLAGTVSPTGLVAGDILQVVVTVAGAVGIQAKGLLIELIFDEDAQ